MSQLITLDTDEQLLKEIILELGGQFDLENNSMPIQELFKFTLEQIKVFKQKDNERDQRIQKLEKAMAEKLGEALERDMMNSR